MQTKDRLRMRAGDSHKIMGYEEVCFSPLPLPTGAAPYSQYLQKHKTKNYLDFGVNDAWHMEEFFRSVFMLLILCLAVLCQILLKSAPRLLCKSAPPKNDV